MSMHLGGFAYKSGHLLALSCFVLLMSSAIAWGDGTPEAKIEAKPQVVEEGPLVVVNHYAGGHTRSYFVAKDGVPLLTNRPMRYRNNRDYVEVEIKFEAVSVPLRYASSHFDGTYTKRDIEYLVRRYANQYGLDEHLILGVIRAESNFDPYAISKAGARGLMQLMPGTALEMQVKNVHDPAQNIAGGTQYLAKLHEEFGDDLDLVLAAYNAGPGIVRRHGGVPPYPETQKYVERVQRYSRLYADNRLSVDFTTTTVRPSGSLASVAN